MHTPPEVWLNTIQSFALNTLALPMGVFSTTGEIIWTNRGMKVLLGADQGNPDPILWLVNPSFDKLVKKADTEGEIFNGTLTAGDGLHLSRSVHAIVYHHRDQLLICATYDVMQLDGLNQKMAEVNRRTNNLQRQIMKQKMSLERTMAKLQKSEARYRRLFESAILGIFQSTSDGRLLEANPEFAKIFGYETPDAMLAGNIDIGRDLYADPIKFQKTVNDIVGAKRGVVVENSYVRKDGTTFVGHLHKWPVVDDQGNLRHMEGFIEDIDEQKRLEAQIQQAKKMEAIGVLAGGIAHEFNNALSGMVGYISLLEMSSNAGSKAKNYCQAMMDLSQRMSRLAQKLLAYAEEGRYRPRVQHLSPLIKLVTGEIKKNQRASDMDFTLDIDRDSPKVTIDEMQIRLVLTTLLENAVEALESSTEGGIISIRLSEKAIETTDDNTPGAITPGRYAHICVHDNGPGMSASVVGLAFEPFFTTKSQGRGMGLAAAYGIIKNHGGWISIESSEGAGTLVEMYLPSAQEEDGTA